MTTPYEPLLEGEQLFLRGCNKDGASHGGFQWPLEVGAIVVAPDWSPEEVCGQGLHGNALRRAVLNTSLGAFCFPPGRCSTRCDHDSQCTLSAGHGDRHETDHGCICYDPTREAP